jgi:hypothetical protein
MTTLTEQIEQLRLQIKEVASDEHALVKELAGTLKQADEKLLREVRLVAAEHEVRRCAVLRELEMLSSRLSLFPRPGNASIAIEEPHLHLSPQTPARRHQSRNDWAQGRGQAAVN